MDYQKEFIISEEVIEALKNNQPVVALESSIISHGMPYPVNIETALMAEETVRKYGAIPATIGVYQGKIVVGLSNEQIIAISNDPNNPETKAMKASVKGLPYAVSQKLNAGLTIAGILRCASIAGIRVMATGGIGGVAKGGEISMDVSADLEEMALSSVAIVGAGCKSILDIGRTKEYLETKDVPVIGLQTDSFPAFFTPKSEYRIDYRMNNIDEAAAFMKAKWDLGFKGSVILANPVPDEFAMDEDKINAAIDEATRLAEELNIKGEKSTPFLLSKVCELTNGDSLKTNIEIIRNNTKVAALVAKAYCQLV
ncbi:pseudouridine-5'-phosphate glycosidase [Traorella massiliensis]|uniref:pseudouridine-5'-phosphate glycosidase n=1 Tax=Traorella massiliensis TaxID=1903263 RepID=UPI0023572061|nr:pseudouridine-5'-phosphate glycosidase [Traorella massiliensis]